MYQNTGATITVMLATINVSPRTKKGRGTWGAFRVVVACHDKPLFRGGAGASVTHPELGTEQPTYLSLTSKYSGSDRCGVAPHPEIIIRIS